MIITIRILSDCTIPRRSEVRNERRRGLHWRRRSTHSLCCRYWVWCSLDRQYSWWWLYRRRGIGFIRKVGGNVAWKIELRITAIMDSWLVGWLDGCIAGTINQKAWHNRIKMKKMKVRCWVRRLALHREPKSKSTREVKLMSLRKKVFSGELQAH